MAVWWLGASSVQAATVLWTSANTTVTLGVPFAELEFENPLTGTETVQGYQIVEWLDADYSAGPPRWYDDWTVSDPASIDGNANEIWMRAGGQSISTVSTASGTAVSIHLVGDGNDGLADIQVDGALVAQLDMGTMPGIENAFILVTGLADTTHTIDVLDQGMGVMGTDIATLGAAVLGIEDVKWIQAPDPSHADYVFYGWNEESIWSFQVPTNFAADDWVCDSAEPLTDVHWWGSYIGWKDQVPPPAWPNGRPFHFHILIWTDVPAGVVAPFSHPGQVIWEIIDTELDQMVSEQFVGWDFDPRTGEWEATFKYDLDINPMEWWEQPGDQGIYWISIAACYEPALPSTAYPWGWKTRPRDTNSTAPDAAVRVFDTDAAPPTWNSDYLVGEPLCWPATGDPCPLDEQWDMAFELTSKTFLGIEKWYQPPDLDPTGIDVMATDPFILANDFECRNTGPLQQIDIWGSWLSDYLPFGSPNNVTFTLSIHDDIPANQNPHGPFSMPGDTLWMRTFNPGDFNVALEWQGEEGWMEPPDSYIPPPFADSQIWRYSFPLDPTDFRQEGTQDDPIIYWLDVQAVPQDPSALFGWKTTPIWDHWNDDSVWASGNDPIPVPGPWADLHYPPMHEWFPQTLDLAFAIYGSDELVSIKWSQPPEPYPFDDIYNGWDEVSMYAGPQIVADDWPCETEDPVTDFHWWGSFLGWNEPVPPYLPDAFHLGIWTDEPVGVLPWSHPDTMLWEYYCPDYTWTFVGWDIYPILDPWHPPEATFLFSCVLPDQGDWFYQEPQTEAIYWVSIAAVAPDIIEFPFGVKTRPSLFMDDAVVIWDPLAPIPGNVFLSGGPLWFPTPDDSWDLAFALTSTVVNPPLPAPAPYDVKKNRYISLDPNNPAIPVALKLNCSVCPGQDMWIAAPTWMTHAGDAEWVSRVTNAPVYRAWPENVIHVSDDEIGPGARYEVRATTDGVNFTAPLMVSTIDTPTPHFWADVAGRYNSGLAAWTPPQGVVDFMDIVAVIHKFLGLPTPHTTWVDLDPNVPQFAVNFGDIIRAVEGFIGLHYPPTGWTTGMCSCTVNADCDDGLFCNGAEVCNGIWCEPGPDPCPNQGCNEAMDVCVPCVVNLECDDGLFCNGAETCQAGFCHPGSYPCGSQPCDESTDTCGAVVAGPLLALTPVSATGGYTISGNEIILHGGGQQVTVELYASGWTPNLLSTYQGTVTPSSYLGETASPPNPGVDLVPVGWPANPDTGAFVDGARLDFVFAAAATETHAVSRPTLQYEWGASSWNNHVGDPGAPGYAGTLILDVPAVASGRYTIHYNPDPTLTWLTDTNWANIAGLKVSPALITIVPATWCEDTCHLGNADLGTPCTTDNDCDIAGGEVCGLKSRYISITPANPATPTSIQVEVVAMTECAGGDRDGLHCADTADCTGGGVCVPSPRIGEIWYAGPSAVGNLPNPPNPALTGAQLQCVPTDVPVPNVQNWTTAGCLHLWGSALVPSSTYDVRHCDATGGNCSPALRIATGKWGDVVLPFGGASQPNFGDISSVVDKFRNVASAPDMPRTDLVGPGNPGTANTPNQVVNFGDISADVDAFRGFPYPFLPGRCP